MTVKIGHKDDCVVFMHNLEPIQQTEQIQRFKVCDSSIKLLLKS